MSGTTETMLRAAMGQEVHGLATPEGMVARAAREHRRRGGRRRAAVSVVTVAATAAGLVTGVNLLTVDRPAAPAPAAPSVTEGPLAAAMAAMRSTTFRMHLVYQQDPARGETTTNADFTGVYDPATGDVVGRNSAGEDDDLDMEIRLVDGKHYTLWPAADPKWRVREGGLPDALVIDGKDGSGPVDGTSPDPWTLFRDGGDLGTVTKAGSTGSGATAVDRYTFGYRLPANDVVQAHEITGEITVQRATQRITRITQETTVIGAYPEIADGEPLILTTEATFSDFGVPVQVTAPDPADVRDPRVDPVTGERLDPEAPADPRIEDVPAEEDGATAGPPS